MEVKKHARKWIVIDNGKKIGTFDTEKEAQAEVEKRKPKKKPKKPIYEEPEQEHDDG